MDKKEKERFAKEFYSRQVILKELGEKGQRKLCESKVAVVGVGGLGSVSSLYLALAGVGYLRVIDQDILETKEPAPPNPLHDRRLGLPKSGGGRCQAREAEPAD